MWFFSADMLKVHLNREHMICQNCGPHKKFTYYKDVFTLNKHWELSHHVCQNENCIAAEGIFLSVFNTDAELEYHDQKTHQKVGTSKKTKGKKGKRKLDASSLLGLNEGEEKPQLTTEEQNEKKKYFLGIIEQLNMDPDTFLHNVRTAQSQGLDVPSELLEQADFYESTLKEHATAVFKSQHGIDLKTSEITNLNDSYGIDVSWQVAFLVNPVQESRG